MEPFWSEVSEPTLRQGDYLPQCLVPAFGPEFAPTGTHDVVADLYDLIVVTQSCDLEQRRARLVAACPIYTITEFESVNAAFAKKGRWNEVLKGRVEGLHLLASPTAPTNNQEAMVVDFREIYSLPFDYLTQRALQLGRRWRLRPPYLEHFLTSLRSVLYAGWLAFHNSAVSIAVSGERSLRVCYSLVNLFGELWRLQFVAYVRNS